MAHETNATAWGPPPAAATELNSEDALLWEALVFLGDCGLKDEELSPSGESGVTTPPPSGLFSSLLLSEPLDYIAITGTTPTPAHCALSNGQSQPNRGSSVPTPAAAATGAAAAKKKSNPTRTKRRDELLYLRETVGILENQLAQVRQAAEAKQLQLEAETSVPSDETAVIIRTAWENIAMHQQEQRQRSEMENIKLKRFLEEQIQVGRSLERLLSRKRPKLEGIEVSLRHEKRVRHGSMSSAWDTTKIFQELIESTDAQYQETTDAMRKAHQVEERAGGQRDIRIVHDPELGMVLRMTETSLLPFQYDATVQELWTTLPEMSTIKPSHFHEMESIEVSADLNKTRFQVDTTFSTPETSVFTVHMVHRRFTEAHRTVVLQSAVLDPTKIGDTKMDGVYMRHRGWIVLEPAPYTSRSTQAATKMTSYRVSVPEAFEDVVDREMKVGTLTNFLLGALSVEMVTRQQNLENRLFERACGTRTGL